MAEIKPLAPSLAAPLDQVFYDIDAVCKVTSQSATQIRRIVRAGDFPAPIPVTDGSRLSHPAGQRLSRPGQRVDVTAPWH